MSKPKLNITAVLTRFNALWRVGRQGNMIVVEGAWSVVKDTLAEHFEIDDVAIAPTGSASPKKEGGMSDGSAVKVQGWPTPDTVDALPARPIVRFKRLPHAADLPLPAYETTGAAAMDLRAADNGRKIMADGYPGIVVHPGNRFAVSTGFEVAIPSGYEGQVRPRSGLAAKFGVTVANAPGTIDSDYRGEIKVLLVNLSPEPFTVAHGDRIAQLVIAPVSQARVEEVTELDSTERGAAGFGSTGVK